MATFIGCNVFEQEIQWVLNRHPEIEFKAHWIPAGLHNDLEILEKTLRQALADNQGAEDLRLLIGNGCSPDLAKIAAEKKLPLLGVKNCLEALLGVERLRELEKGRTMVITPSWLRKVWFSPEGMRAVLGWSDVDFRLNFGRYDRSLVLDPLIEPVTDMEILEAFEVIQVPLEVEYLSLEHFEKFVINFLS
jgi:hypothetical protein